MALTRRQYEVESMTSGARTLGEFKNALPGLTQDELAGVLDEEESTLKLVQQLSEIEGSQTAVEVFTTRVGLVKSEIATRQ